MPNGVDVRSPWNTHSSMPWSLRTTFGMSSSHFFGTWFLYMSGGSMKWSSMLTRIMSSICMGVPPVCPALPSRVPVPASRRVSGTAWGTGATVQRSNDRKGTEMAETEYIQVTHRELPFSTFDADNHLYENSDAMTKFLPPEYEGVIKYVEIA